jgi:hypothetical protein
VQPQSTGFEEGIREGEKLKEGMGVTMFIILIVAMISQIYLDINVKACKTVQVSVHGLLGINFVAMKPL